MSTCIGAPAPHDNCPHGKACDWGQPLPAWPQHDYTALNCHQRRDLDPVALGAVCPACKGSRP